jgi:hypothetical protein
MTNAKKDFDLMQSILEKAEKGINMNLLAFRSPVGYIIPNHAQQTLVATATKDTHGGSIFNVPANLQFRATNNLLELHAAIYMPWIDLIKDRLK